MLGSSMRHKHDKRNRLIQSAIKLFHQKGVAQATLADIATAADVPLGNVYYYFKLKTEIINSVIKHHFNILQQFLTVLDNKTQKPKERLKFLLEQDLSEQESIINFGNPLGGLCMDLGESKENFTNLWPI